MTDDKTGGPAFPALARWERSDQLSKALQFYGMTLRDYFAAKAMQGICASKDEAGTLVNHGYDWIASEAYRIADAMLEARK